MAEEEEAPLNEQPRSKRNYYVIGGIAVAFLLCCLAVAVFVTLAKRDDVGVTHSPIRTMDRPKGCHCVYVGDSKEKQPSYDLGGYICVCFGDKKIAKNTGGL
ncbi:uncharacterized protein LOC144134792 [Amblyomma americanum]